MAIKMIAGAMLLLTGCATAANAREITVQMVNRSGSQMMVFEPNYVRATPGDTIKFVATDKGHNVETIPGMIPVGAPSFRSSFGQNISVILTKPGVYGFKCSPHYFMGMVGLIVVGKPVNLAQANAVAQVGKAKSAFASLLSRAKTEK